MKSKMDKLFNDDILLKSANLFGVNFDNVVFLGGFESLVYTYKIESKKFILKITDSLKRKFNYIMGELEFVEYLSNKGVSVSRSVRSINGNLLEKIPTDCGDFLICSFEYAEGGLIDNKERNSELFNSWGVVTAKMHLAAETYKPSKKKYKRLDWDEHFVFDFENNYGNDIEIKNYVKEFMNKLKKLPINNKTYGLIHADLHPKNFFNKDGVLNVFDFDDCSYHRYINDIAIILYYAKKRINFDLSGAEFVNYFLEHFLLGYRSIRQIDEFWIKQIPLFMKIRILIMYSLSDNYLSLYKSGKKTKEQYERFVERKENIVNSDRENEGF